MPPIHAHFVGRKHPWTSLDINWQLDDVDVGNAALTADQRDRINLIRYLSSGGLRTFASSIGRDLVERQQSRFLRLVFLLGVLWLVFWFI